MSKLPAWLKGTTHRDWLIDGEAIRGEYLLGIWRRLDWSNARMDVGPSPTGNTGPYWKVAAPAPWDDVVHRLYPRLSDKWLNVVRRAIEEASGTVGQRVTPAVTSDCAGPQSDGRRT